MNDGFARDGFILWPTPLEAEGLIELETMFARLTADRPGVRIDPAVIHQTAISEALRPAIRSLFRGPARPVRALLFDKHDGANWALGWHQDRTIEVKRRVDVPGFGAWTDKGGRLHVAPPIALLERMITVRVHLDAVDADNAPLKVAPGSHRLGYIPENTIADVVARLGEVECLAGAGSIWLYATPILHASSRARAGRRRRVLQLDFSAEDLPGGLAWAADGVTLEDGASLA